MTAYFDAKLVNVAFCAKFTKIAFDTATWHPEKRFQQLRTFLLSPDNYLSNGDIRIYTRLLEIVGRSDWIGSKTCLFGQHVSKIWELVQVARLLPVEVSNIV